MKFAKTLQQELYQEWIDQYLDYKMMKKVLKQDEPEAAGTFCGLLESELMKIRAFMRGQQALIGEAVNPLEFLAFGARNTGSPSECKIQILTQAKPQLQGHCSQLVKDIENFRNYAALNQTAVSKIIKKFNKRFNVTVVSPLEVDMSWTLPLTESDIGSWLLAPALQCLELMRDSVGLPLVNVERPLRQLNFWIEELRAGVQLTSMTMNDGFALDDRTPVRLRLYGDEQEHWAVRNTFISCTERDASEPTRARSLPPRLGGPPLDVLWEDDSPRPAVPATTTTLREIRFKHEDIQSRCNNNKGGADKSEGNNERRGPSTGHIRTSASSRERARPCRQGACPCPEDRKNGTERPAGGRKSVCQEPRRGVSPKIRVQRGAAPEDSKDARPLPSRWWTTVTEMCPLSGFPICMLPYPPLKLQKQGVTLVDGVFLVLQVLATWRFEAAGNPLGSSEIVAIDAYMKRCKLGPFRLGRALELMSKGTPEAMKELESIRHRAHRRLDTVRQIQRGRMIQHRDKETKRVRH